jgi:hypothetical protein
MSKRLFREQVYATVKEVLCDEWLPASEIAKRAQELGNRRHIRLNANNTSRVMRFMWTKDWIERIQDSGGNMLYRRLQNENAGTD